MKIRGAGTGPGGRHDRRREESEQRRRPGPSAPAAYYINLFSASADPARRPCFGERARAATKSRLAPSDLQRRQRRVSPRPSPRLDESLYYPGCYSIYTTLFCAPQIRPYLTPLCGHSINNILPRKAENRQRLMLHKQPLNITVNFVHFSILQSVNGYCIITIEQRPKGRKTGGKENEKCFCRKADEGRQL